ncbi:DUF2868 domain-containing protein [Salinibius halmophilus]|uniref:DUF2868 domain-containing protein n=1 Tax=Salinibius halmophilus TaxID=1853216 RepID=UPI000E66C449|nr:DUF2868 domain-containing protein [Salinibius halmophilus]
MSQVRKLVEAKWLEEQVGIAPAGQYWREKRSELALAALPKLAWLDYATWLALVLGAMLGASFITGLLLVNSEQTVNVMVFLAATVVLPWLVKVFSWMMPKRTGGAPWQQHWLVSRSWWAQVQLFSTTSALITFIFWLLVTDITFVWRSTLLEPNQVLLSALNFLSLPWQWLVPSATVSNQLLVDSQIYRQGGDLVSALATRQWWSFLLLSMVVWVWLPRLIDCLRYQWLIKRSLKALEAGPVHQHLQRQELQQAASVQVSQPMLEQPARGFLSGDVTHFYWRMGKPDDLATLPFAQACELLTNTSSPVAVNVLAHTTPTAELADIVNSQEFGWLVLHSVDNQSDLLSWQQFLSRYLPTWQVEQK